MATLTVTARNLATSSENKIHDDVVARQYGFRGGLVPGVTAYTYLARTILDEYGIGWLSGGRASARFVAPIYDGGDVVASFLPETGELTVVDSHGAVCVSGSCIGEAGPHDESGADVGDGPYAASSFGPHPLPATRPAADEISLAPGTRLGSLHKTFDVAAQVEYLAAVGLDDPHCSPAGIAHPGVLLLDANAILVANVRLGPWMHVGSDVHAVVPVPHASTVDVFANVVDRYERKGHQFVVFDVLTLADGALAHRVRHTAIYQPRTRETSVPHGG